MEAILLITLTFAPSRGDATPDRQRAVKELQAVGGKAETSADGTRVTLREGDVTDNSLENAAALGNVVEIDLSFAWQVTDAGLARLAGLKGLRALRLVGTRVGDEGMKTVAGLTGLRRLALPQVSDVGLRRLKG